MPVFVGDPAVLALPTLEKRQLSLYYCFPSAVILTASLISIPQLQGIFIPVFLSNVIIC